MDKGGGVQGDGFDIVRGDLIDTLDNLVDEEKHDTDLDSFINMNTIEGNTFNVAETDLQVLIV